MYYCNANTDKKIPINCCGSTVFVEDRKQLRYCINYHKLLKVQSLSRKLNCNVNDNTYIHISPPLPRLVLSSPSRIVAPSEQLLPYYVSAYEPFFQSRMESWKLVARNCLGHSWKVRHCVSVLPIKTVPIRLTKLLYFFTISHRTSHLPYCLLFLLLNSCCHREAS